MRQSRLDDFAEFKKLVEILSRDRERLRKFYQSQLENSKFLAKTSAIAE